MAMLFVLLPNEMDKIHACSAYKPSCTEDMATFGGPASVTSYILARRVRTALATVWTHTSRPGQGYEVHRVDPSRAGANSLVEVARAATSLPRVSAQTRSEVRWSQITRLLVSAKASGVNAPLAVAPLRQERHGHRSGGGKYEYRVCRRRKRDGWEVRRAQEVLQLV